MTLRQRITTLEAENGALRSKLSARLALDRDWQGNLSDGVFAVAKNLSNFNDLNKERILLAVAVLYGIVRPATPEPCPDPKEQK